MTKSTKSIKSKLIFKGSSGCIFRPHIPCQKNKTKKKSKKKVTKVIFDKRNHEYDFTKIIKKIKGHQKWTVLWEDACESQPYEKLLEHTDINKCISNEEDYSRVYMNHRFLLYQGSYGGVTLDNYCKENISRTTLTNQTKFNKYFIKIFRLLRNVFYGLSQLYKHNICHHDINCRNILIKGKKSFIIDYDISLKINSSIETNNFLRKRMTAEYYNLRLYESYPFEYLYYILNKPDEILREQENIGAEQDWINYYELYEPIHRSIFDTDTDKLRLELLASKLRNEKQNLTELMRELDMYSLGMTILILFLDASFRLNIPIAVVVTRLRSKELKPYMDLIRDMISFNYQDRITTDEAYERYLNLIR